MCVDVKPTVRWVVSLCGWVVFSSTGRAGKLSFGEVSGLGAGWEGEEEN